MKYSQEKQEHGHVVKKPWLRIEYDTGRFCELVDIPQTFWKTLNWAKSIEGEWDKKAKIDEDYQKVLEKANKGKELSDDDVKKINAYKESIF